MYLKMKLKAVLAFVIRLGLWVECCVINTIMTVPNSVRHHLPYLTVLIAFYQITKKTPRPWSMVGVGVWQEGF